MMLTDKCLAGRDMRDNFRNSCDARARTKLWAEYVVNDNDHSSNRLSLLKTLTCPEHGPWSIPCLANCGIMKAHVGVSSASLVPLEVKWVCIFSGEMVMCLDHVEECRW